MKSTISPSRDLKGGGALPFTKRTGFSVYPYHSLPHWVAYWATGNLQCAFEFGGLTTFLGWKMTCTFYCLKIEETLDAMIRLSDEVLSENRRTIYPHINEVWKMVMVFVRSIGRDEGTEELTMCPTFVGEGPTRTRELISRFESYVNAEEKRLQRNLGVMNYRIDSPDTFRVIAGDGRIETVSRALGNAVAYCTFLIGTLF